MSTCVLNLGFNPCEQIRSTTNDIIPAELIGANYFCICRVDRRFVYSLCLNVRLLKMNLHLAVSKLFYCAK